jgi:hypothetical protein
MEQWNTSIPMVTFCILPPLFPSWQPTPLLLLWELTDPSITTKVPLCATDSRTPGPQRSLHSEFVATGGDTLFFQHPIIIITKQYQEAFLFSPSRMQEEASCYFFSVTVRANKNLIFHMQFTYQDRIIILANILQFIFVDASICSTN